MRQDLLDLLRELERFGAANDASTTDRSQRMLNITHDTGVFLALLIKAGRCRNALEIGTSNGYSTLWLADAVGDQGTVTTIERAPHKIEMARRNFERAGLASRIRQIQDEAGHVLETRAADRYDFIFLDSDRTHYPTWWPLLRAILAPGCLLVVDNAISHAHEMEEFRRAIDATDGILASLVPIGNGELVVLNEA